MPKPSKKFTHRGAEVTVHDPEISIEEAQQMTDQVLDIVSGKAELIPLRRTKELPAEA